MENYTKFLEKNINLLSECCIENMVTKIFLDYQWEWNIEECVNHYEQYLKKKFCEDSLNLPFLLEIIIICEIANLYLKLDNKDEYSKWMKRAILESCGKQNIQEYIRQIELEKVEFKISLFIDWLKKYNV
jgi:hypothetical protein